MEAKPKPFKIKELIYIWVEEYKNIKKTGFNLSNRYDIEYTKNLSVNIKELPIIIPENFFGKSIINVTGIIGKNGVGKSSLIKIINYAFDFLLGWNAKENEENLEFIELFDKKELLLIFEVEEEATKSKQYLLYKIEFPTESKDKKENAKTEIKKTYLISDELEFTLDESNFKENNNLPFEIPNIIYYSNTYENKRLAVQKIQDVSNTGLLYKQRMDIDKYAKLFQDDFIRQSLFLKQHSAILEKINFNIPVKFTIELLTGFDPRKKLGSELDKNDSEISAKEYIVLGIINYIRVIINKKKFGSRLNFDDEDRKYIECLNEQPNEMERIEALIKGLKDELDNLEKEWIAEKKKDKEKKKKDYGDKKELKDLNRIFNFHKIKRFLKDIDKYLSNFEILRNKAIKRRNLFRVEEDINFKNKEDIENIINFFDTLNITFSQPAGEFIEFGWVGLSSGEIAILNVLSRFNKIKAEKKNESNFILISIDEGELFLHPEWQRKYINILFDAIPIIFPEHQIQILISSHSPFIVSDLPRENIIFLEQDNDKKPMVKKKDSPYKEKNTFAANIHSLFANSFFMEGLIGEFAKGKINEIIDFYKRVKQEEAKEKSNFSDLKKEYQEKENKKPSKQNSFWNIQKIIGEEYLAQIIKNHLEEIDWILILKEDPEKRNGKKERLKIEMKRLRSEWRQLKQ